MLGVENNIFGADYPFYYAVMHAVVGNHLHKSALMILFPLDDLLGFDGHSEQHYFFSRLAEQDE